jgi:hypothetical protein
MRVGAYAEAETLNSGSCGFSYRQELENANPRFSARTLADHRRLLSSRSQGNATYSVLTVNCNSDACLAHLS